MSVRRASLNELEQSAFYSAIWFLSGRLEERATIEWALKLTPIDSIKRLALLELINNPDGLQINEPWRSAWRLIEESWNNQEVEGDNTNNEYFAQLRLSMGDRSGSLITAIVQLVAPRLKVEAFSDMHLNYRKPPKQPKKVEDLFVAELTSGDVLDPKVLNIDSLADLPFLVELAHSLEAVVINGLDIARRLGWEGEHHLWKLGMLNRVYYVPVDKRDDEENEPDQFHRGIAPAVKLLNAVVSRLVDLDVSLANEFVRRWKLTKSPVHIRLAAALSRKASVLSANEIGNWLLSLDDTVFWGIDDYPEIAELRAVRFGELDPHDQAALAARIRKRPPRRLWPRKGDANRINDARLYWALRELRRIEIASGSLTEVDKDWLDKRVKQFPDLLQMTKKDDGFPQGVQVTWAPVTPDTRYDLISGEERLKTLETSLDLPRGGWDDEPRRRALDWIRQPGNSLQILADFESIPNAGAAFPLVWEYFGWEHTPHTVVNRETPKRDSHGECERVLALIGKLPETTLVQAIEGISQWLLKWNKKYILSDIFKIWFKLWPMAVQATNTRQSNEEESRINTIVQSADDYRPIGVDTLNTPVGKLVQVFLAGRPDITKKEQPFKVGSWLTKMRDEIITATDRSGLIARYCMIEILPYFLRADQAWSHKHLIAPLKASNAEALALWRAVARRTRFKDVLKIIGQPMVERATDPRLEREARRSLVFSLVIECLHAFHEQRDPAVPFGTIQQMIRSLDDEVRVGGARAIQIFIRDVSAAHEGEGGRWLPENLFHSAVAPFLNEVWPQERSLSTPSVSEAFAAIPSRVRGAFAEAVHAIERFLVPFKCWTMNEYGLYGEENGTSKLVLIDDQEKAAALLRLLDLTIGTAEGTIIPRGLPDALDQIRKIAPSLSQNKAFRRLTAATRR